MPVYDKYVFPTAPLELIKDTVEQRDEAELKDLGEIYYQELEKKEQKQYNITDIVHLASAEQVHAGISLFPFNLRAV